MTMAKDCVEKSVCCAMMCNILTHNEHNVCLPSAICAIIQLYPLITDTGVSLRRSGGMDYLTVRHPPVWMRK